MHSHATFEFQARAQEEAQKKEQQLEAERQQREEAERFEAIQGNRQRRQNRRNRRNISETQDQGVFKWKIPLLVFFSAFLTSLLAVYFYY